MRLWPFLIILGVHLFLIGPMATGHRAPGFRDSAYMYFPLYEWIERETRNDEIPFWNPYDRFGTPVVEDATTSVFYPGKVVFRLSVVSYVSRFGLYILFHSLLGALGAYWCARVLRCQQSGATLAAIAYSLSGSVLFQVCNIVFLVSAAWLPWSLGFWWLLFNKKKKTAIAGNAACLAMMVLGGDPQMAYHSALIGGAMVLASLWQNSASWKVRLRLLLVRASWYGCVGSLAVGLSAIQLIPTAAHAKFSERSRADGQRPRSIYEVAEYLREHAEPSPEWKDVTKALTGVPDPETHHADVYDFSLAPWSAAQLFWPNHTGRWMPEFRRWVLPFHWSQKIWTPSIYMGLFPILLAMVAFRIRGADRQQVWLSWISMIFALGSLGSFGLFWLIQAVPGGTLSDQTHGAVGGVYWMMVTFLPKYVVFRYPAKLFVVASLAISLLAARQMSGRRVLQSKWLPRLLIAAFIFSIVGLVYFNHPYFRFPLDIEKIGAHEIYGPFDAAGCLFDIRVAMLSTMVLCAFGLGSLWLIRKRQASLRQLKLAFLMVTVVELLIANSWLVLTVESKSLTELTPKQQDLLAQIEQQKSESSPLVRFTRFGRSLSVPWQWAHESSETRLDEVAIWQRETLYPKFHLQNNVALVDSFSSIEIDPASIEYESSPIPYKNDSYEIDEASARKMLLIGSVQSSGDTKAPWPAIRSTKDPDFQLEPDQLVGQGEPFPIAIYFDLDPTLVIGLNRQESGTVQSFRNNQMVFDWTGNQDHEIIVSQSWAPGWRAEATVNEIPATRETIAITPYDNGRMKVTLPPTLHEAAKRGATLKIQMTYRPPYFDIGLWLSVVAWHVLAAFGLMTVLPKRFQGIGSRPRF